MQLLRAKGLDETFAKMNRSLPAEYRRGAVCELADEIMTGINFAGVNGTTHLLVSTLAHLVRRTSDVPAASLAFLAGDMLELFKRDANAFIIESCVARSNPRYAMLCYAMLCYAMLCYASRDRTPAALLPAAPRD